jgi:hypothetical protein
MLFEAKEVNVRFLLFSTGQLSFGMSNEEDFD